MTIHYLTLRTKDANYEEVQNGFIRFNLPSSFYDKIKGDCYVSCLLVSFLPGFNGRAAMYVYFDFGAYNHNITNNDNNYIPLARLSSYNALQYIGSNKNRVKGKIPKLGNTIKVKFILDDGTPYNFSLTANPAVIVLKFETKDEDKELNNYLQQSYKFLQDFKN